MYPVRNTIGQNESILQYSKKLAWNTIAMERNKIKANKLKKKTVFKMSCLLNLSITPKIAFALLTGLTSLISPDNEINNRIERY